MKLPFLLVVVVASLIGEGACQCDPKLLLVSQAKTGKVYAKSYVEYNVTVTNPCECAQGMIFLRCPGFHSYTKMDVKVLSPAPADQCFIHYGSSIPSMGSWSFTYAWTQQCQFKPVSSGSHCPSQF